MSSPSISAAHNLLGKISLEKPIVKSQASLIYASIKFSIPRPDSNMKVAVVGGSPSGLVTLKYLLEAHTFSPIEPIEARLFESESSVGGTFKHRSYEDAEVSPLFFYLLLSLQMY
jgi:hypothetical protein